MEARDEDAQQRATPETGRKRGGALLGDLIGPPEDAPEKPGDGKCVDCSAAIEAQWLSIARRWWVASRCAVCAEKADAVQRRDRKARQDRVAFEERMRSARLTSGRREKTFASFQSRPGLEDALRAAEAFVAQKLRRKPHRGLLFFGPNGTGKSHLAAAILNAVLDAQPKTTGIFIEFADYLEALRHSFSDSSTVHPAWLRETMFRVDLLVLDDLGAGRQTGRNWDSEEMARLLNRRNDNRLPIIATTDLHGEEIEEQLGSRVRSRLYEACEIVPIDESTEDFRKDMGRSQRGQS